MAGSAGWTVLVWAPSKHSVNHATEVKNLWHIGASTHPGRGWEGRSGYLRGTQGIRDADGESRTSPPRAGARPRIGGPLAEDRPVPLRRPYPMNGHFMGPLQLPSFQSPLRDHDLTTAKMRTLVVSGRGARLTINELSVYAVTEQSTIETARVEASGTLGAPGCAARAGL